MRWLRHSLNRKFVIGTAAGLLLSSLVFLVLFMGLYRAELEAERARAAAQVNQLLQTSLENAMLKRDLEGLQDIVQRLGEQAEIARVFITNPAGQVRFTSDPDVVQPQRVPSTSTTVFLEAPDGKEVLRSINPVNNKPACFECHGAVEQNPINGILYVDYNASPVRDQARRTTLLLMGSGALIVLLNISGGWWFIRRFVIGPTERLAVVSDRLSQGDLSARSGMTGQDELQRLGTTFDRMAERLQEKVETLEEQQEFLQRLVDAIPDGVRIIDSDYRIILTNLAYREQLRLDDKSDVGETCYHSAYGLSQPCAPTLTTCPLHEITRTGKDSVRVLHSHRRADGSPIDVEIYAAAMRVRHHGKEQVLIVESIRDLAKQVKYSQEQKLSELGRLAAGVAHEIHNPLASVRMALNATESKTREDGTCPPEVARYLELVDREIDKCINVTERLLKLSAPPSVNPELVTLDRVVTETLSLLRWEAEHDDVDISEDLQPGTRVVASDSEMRMLVLNLAQNAFHAMPDGGTLTVRLRGDENGVTLEVEDNGAGISPDGLKHIFEPFYSRRADESQGTGLGLPISQNIVENWGGKITVESESGQGTRFTVHLPPAKQQLDRLS
jgi:signal transduction histidine kinase